MVSYFELYGIPVSFHPDKDTVKKKFYELSRLYHPDRFTLAPKAERAEALRTAAINNEAYKIFNNPDATMAYILRLNGMLEDEEKYNLPADFLMEMMDLNEVVSEYEMEPDNESQRQQATNLVAQQFDEWNEQVSPLIEEFDKNPGDEQLLLKIKDYYFRKKYLLRIQERINTFATR